MAGYFPDRPPKYAVLTTATFWHLLSLPESFLSLYFLFFFFKSFFRSIFFYHFFFFKYVKSIYCVTTPCTVQHVWTRRSVESIRGVCLLWERNSMPASLAESVFSCKGWLQCRREGSCTHLPDMLNGIQTWWPIRLFNSWNISKSFLCGTCYVQLAIILLKHPTESRGHETNNYWVHDTIHIWRAVMLP